MRYRIVKLIHPFKSKDNDSISISVSKVPFIKKDMSIYETVAFFEQKIFPKIKTSKKRVSNKIKLRDIVNLHNDDGIRKISQIESMLNQINSGKDVLMPSNLPNIKLVKTKKSEFVLFDGHHSLLAYMISGMKYLHEVPHLIVENKHGHVSAKEISVFFFGRHSEKLKDWRKYAINWQAPKEKQLCKRIQDNLGEVLDSLVVSAKSSLARR
ncbi:MAG: hypothetical protein ABIH64_01435 [Nanoarchaeota archaeon]